MMRSDGSEKSISIPSASRLKSSITLNSPLIPQLVMHEVHRLHLIDGRAKGNSASLNSAHSAGQSAAECLCRAIHSHGALRVAIAIPVGRSR